MQTSSLPSFDKPFVSRRIREYIYIATSHVLYHEFIPEPPTINMSSIANLPKTYTAAVQKEAGEPFEFVDVEMKEPGAGKVLVKVLACGVCHSDSIVKNEIMPVLPKVPGHEVVGNIVATGEGRRLL
jgi:hypothetical protein